MARDGMFADQSGLSPNPVEVNDIRHLNERRSLTLSGDEEALVYCRMIHNRTRLSSFGEHLEWPRPDYAQSLQPKPERQRMHS